MRFGAGLSRYSAVIVGVLLGLTAAWLILRRTAGGRAFLLTATAAFLQPAAIAAESGGPGALPPLCSMMLSSGLDVDQSLDMACQFD